MTILNILAFSGAMFLLAVTPGPGVFATTARALTKGFPHAALLAAGIVAGDLLFLVMAIYGLSSIAELLGGFFTVVRICGGCYLLWLGLQMWRAKPTPPDLRERNELSWQKNFLSGLAITLGNPKVILFYLGFLPTFLDLHSLRHIDVFLAAGVVCVVLGSVLLVYAYTAARARKLFSNTRAIRILNRSSGAVMMAAGSVLLTRN